MWGAAHGSPAFSHSLSPPPSPPISRGHGLVDIDGHYRQASLYLARLHTAQIPAADAAWSWIHHCLPLQSLSHCISFQYAYCLLPVDGSPGCYNATQDCTYPSIFRSFGSITFIYLSTRVPLVCSPVCKVASAPLGLREAPIFNAVGKEASTGHLSMMLQPCPAALVSTVVLQRL